MKNNISNLLFSISNSCSGLILASNMWTSINVLFYDKEGNDIREDNLSTGINDYLKSLKIKVTSDNYKETFEVMYFDAGRDRIKLPLKLNAEYFNKELPNLNSDYESFDYTLLHEDKIIFHNKFKVKYKAGNPFEIITEVSYLDSNGEWKEYKPTKKEIIIEGKPTGIFFSVEATVI